MIVEQIDDDDDVAIVVNPAEAIGQRLERMKLSVSLMMSRPFPGAFLQLKGQFASFDQQLEAEEENLARIKTEWTALKQDVGIPFLRSLPTPEEFNVATGQALENYKEELKTFFSDKGSDEYRMMLAKLENLAYDAIAVGRGPEVDELRANLEARGVPLLERLQDYMNSSRDVEIVDLTANDLEISDAVGNVVDAGSLPQGSENLPTEEEIGAAKESFRREIQEYIKSVLFQYYEKHPEKFQDPENQGKALLYSLTSKIYEVEVHSWDIGGSANISKLVLTDNMKNHIKGYAKKRLDKYK